MTVVIGTAGHIDHGKTLLLKALTGIDADRLPEEHRRGMTIDVGYAHLVFDDGTELDFVDVPGHDRLVGNMLVGAGEIDAAMLVVAADDGVRAQTREHLALLDALGIRDGLAVVTKADVVDPARVAAVIAEVEAVLEATSLAGAPVLAVSSVTGAGLAAVRAMLEDVADRIDARTVADSGRAAAAAPATLAIDRVFSVKGRGVVVTGTLRGGRMTHGATLRLVPGDGSARVREIQVHGRTVESTGPGRTALNLAGVDAAALHRGAVLTSDPAVEATTRVLVRLSRPIPDRARARLHLGTASTDVSVGRSGRDAIGLPGGTVAAILRLAEPLAAAPGDRFVLRRSGGADPVVGGSVLDVAPARGVSRRRQTSQRVAALASAIDASDRAAATAARLDLHGAIPGEGTVLLAPDVSAVGASAADAIVVPEAALPAVRAAVAGAIRKVATLRRDAAAAAASQLIDEEVRAGRLVRDGDRLRRPGLVEAPDDPALLSAMDRLEQALTTAAPPSLHDAARSSGCPRDGVRRLERTGRIVVLDPDLAYASTTYQDLTARALMLATSAPLTPAAFRDATGTSRKYVMAILEDLDRRGILARGPDGHRPGPKAPAR